MKRMPLRAFLLAQEAHYGQTRKYTGAPYLVHPFRVANKVRALGGDDILISAAVLHDTLEDTDLDPFRIAWETDTQVLELVRELTNPSGGMGNRKARNVQRLSKVSRAARFIKLLDRRDNLLDMHGAPAKFRALYLEESKGLLHALAGTDVRAEALLGAAIRQMGGAA